MKRFRLSTLMLLVLIAGLIMALVVQHQRAAGREAELRDRVARLPVESAVLTLQSLQVQQSLNASHQKEKSALVNPGATQSSK